MLSALLFLGGSLLAASPTPADSWPGWRGASSNAVARGAPPTEWSEDHNLRWKLAIEGKGLSSPIAFDGTIFLTTAVPSAPPAADKEGAVDQSDPSQHSSRRRRGAFGVSTPPSEQAFKVMAIDHATGAVKWVKTSVTLTPHEGKHSDGSYATPTPVTDGQRLYVSFGSFGIFAYDFDGELLWQTDLGDMHIFNSFGEGSSPVLAGGHLIMLWAHDGDSFLVALDCASGEEVWRQERASGTGWSTPLVVASEEGEQVIIGGSSTQAYDAKSGALRWFHGKDGRPQPASEEAEEEGQSRSRRGSGSISTPVLADGTLYMCAGGRGGSLIALALEPQQEQQPERLLWSHRGDTSSVPSPIVVDGVLYSLRGNSGVLSALDALSGDVLYRAQRFDALEGAYASPVSADGKLYFSGRDGTFEVIATGPEFEVLAVNRLDDQFDASPAVVGDTLLLRGLHHLYCVGTDGR